MKKGTGTLIGVIVLVVCMLTAYIVTSLCFETVPIKGESMEPTVFNDDLVIIVKTQKVKAGDVIVGVVRGLRDENGHVDTKVIKRVIGVAGDKIAVRENEAGVMTVYRNGSPLKEDYIKEQPFYHLDEVMVPDGVVFFLGDNRNHSTDSHELDRQNNRYYIKISDIHGKVFFRYRKESWDMNGIKNGFVTGLLGIC